MVQIGDLAAEDVSSVARALLSAEGLREALASSEEGKLFARVVTLNYKAQALRRIQRAAENAASSEQDLQRALWDEWWIFGGQYIDRTKRRALTVLDELDIPLIKYDGSLHIVELKKANIPRLVRMPRSHWVVGPEINEAVVQAMSYLRSLDENRANILAELDLDCRRASATIVIGDPIFVGDATETDVYEALRTYNSHLSRVSVTTYKELLDGAQRAIQLGD
jgi:hypothetical protein